MDHYNKEKDMKIEIKHLAPYLPYGLTCDHGAVDDPEYGILTQLDCSMGVEDGQFNNDRVTVPLQLIRPILKPLSKLHKKIEHNGEKFVPLSVLYDIVNAKHFFEALDKKGDKIIEIWVMFENGRYENWQTFHIDRLSFKHSQKLFEWHFDVFELIEQNLAIDSN